MHGQHVANLLRPQKTTAHAGRLLGQSDQPDRGAAGVELLDHQAPAGREDPHHFGQRFPLGGEVVQRIHHQDALEAPVAERQLLGARGHGGECFGAGPGQHVGRGVGDHHLPGKPAKHQRNPPRAASAVQQPA